MDFELGHFSHRWHHRAHGHHDACSHNAAPKDDLGRLGLVLAVGRVISGAVALVWTVYAARRLQGDWGQLSAVLSYAAVVSIGTDLGIPLALTKLACRHDPLDRKAVMTGIRRRAVAGSVASVLLVLAWVNTSSANGRWGLAVLYGISVTVTPVTGSLLALLRGRAIGEVEAVYDVVRELALPALGIAAIDAGLGVFGLLGSIVIVDAASAFAVSQVTRRRIPLTDKADAGEEAEMRLSQTVPLSASTIVGSAYDRVDSAMLAPLAGTAAVGIYRMISPIYGAVLMPAHAIGDAAAVGAGRGEGHEARGTAAKFALRAAVVTVPLAVALALVGPPVLPHLLKVKASVQNPHPINWSRAAGPLRVLMLAAIPGAALAVLTPVALFAHRDRVFGFALGALVVNIALNLALVPHWAVGMGATGAALAFLITELGLAITLWASLPPTPTIAAAGASSAAGPGQQAG